MPVYLSPGVYVEEIPPTARPIAGVGTSIAGFIGVVADNVVMPVKPGESEARYQVATADIPFLVTSWASFKTHFGDIQTANKTIAHAVYGFFNNGGSRCWVIRVAEPAAITNPAQVLEKFEAIDEITIVAIPGATSGAQHEALIAHCSNLKDRFAILDGVQAPTAQTPEAIAPVGRSGPGSYSAIYFPWLKVSDPVDGAIISVPPAGHIAGIYARSDSTRGVHKAPANEVVLGAVDLNHALSKSDQDGLNPEGINIIRSFNGSIKVWGGRTRADNANSDFRYLSTRRYFNFLRESIDEGTQFVVFEPNNQALWQRINRTVGDFLLRQWREGALFGETPQQAFFVKCDKDTNPPDVREAGQVVTEIGVAIVKPAEFVIFRIQQTTGG